MNVNNSSGIPAVRGVKPEIIGLFQHSFGSIDSDKLADNSCSSETLHGDYVPYDLGCPLLDIEKRCFPPSFLIKCFHRFKENGSFDSTTAVVSLQPRDTSRHPETQTVGTSPVESSVRHTADTFYSEDIGSSGFGRGRGRGASSSPTSDYANAKSFGRGSMGRGRASSNMQASTDSFEYPNDQSTLQDSYGQQRGPPKRSPTQEGVPLWRRKNMEGKIPANDESPTEQNTTAVSRTEPGEAGFLIGRSDSSRMSPAGLPPLISAAPVIPKHPNSKRVYSRTDGQAVNTGSSPVYPTKDAPPFLTNHAPQFGKFGARNAEWVEDDWGSIRQGGTDSMGGMTTKQSGNQECPIKPSNSQSAEWGRRKPVTRGPATGEDLRLAAGKRREIDGEFEDQPTDVPKRVDDWGSIRQPDNNQRFHNAPPTSQLGGWSQMFRREDNIDDRGQPTRTQPDGTIEDRRNESRYSDNYDSLDVPGRRNLLPEPLNELLSGPPPPYIGNQINRGQEPVHAASVINPLVESILRGSASWDGKSEFPNLQQLDNRALIDQVVGRILDRPTIYQPEMASPPAGFPPYDNSQRSPLFYNSLLNMPPDQLRNEGSYPRTQQLSNENQTSNALLQQLTRDQLSPYQSSVYGALAAGQYSNVPQQQPFITGYRRPSIPDNRFIQPGTYEGPTPYDEPRYPVVGRLPEHPPIDSLYATISRRQEPLETSLLRDSFNNKQTFSGRYQGQQSNSIPFPNPMVNQIPIHNYQEPPHRDLITNSPTSINDSVWEYLDPKGQIQGRFSSVQMKTWSDGNFFSPNLLMRYNPNHPWVKFADLYPDGLSSRYPPFMGFPLVEPDGTVIYPGNVNQLQQRLVSPQRTREPEIPAEMSPTESYQSEQKPTILTKEEPWGMKPLESQTNSYQEQTDRRSPQQLANNLKAVLGCSPYSGDEENRDSVDLKESAQPIEKAPSPRQPEIVADEGEFTKVVSHKNKWKMNQQQATSATTKEATAAAPMEAFPAKPASRLNKPVTSRPNPPVVDFVELMKEEERKSIQNKQLQEEQRMKEKLKEQQQQKLKDQERQLKDQERQLKDQERQLKDREKQLKGQEKLSGDQADERMFLSSSSSLSAQSVKGPAWKPLPKVAQPVMFQMSDFPDPSDVLYKGSSFGKKHSSDALPPLSGKGSKKTTLSEFVKTESKGTAVKSVWGRLPAKVSQPLAAETTLPDAADTIPEETNKAAKFEFRKKPAVETAVTKPAEQSNPADHTTVSYAAAVKKKAPANTAKHPPPNSQSQTSKSVQPARSLSDSELKEIRQLMESCKIILDADMLEFLKGCKTSQDIIDVLKDSIEDRTHLSYFATELIAICQNPFKTVTYGSKGVSIPSKQATEGEQTKITGSTLLSPVQNDSSNRASGVSGRNYNHSSPAGSSSADCTYDQPDQPSKQPVNKRDKKREKGKPVDPSLLGFSVKSNRIMQGAIDYGE